MTSDTKGTLASLVVWAFVFAVVLGVAGAFDAIKCHVSWDDSGYEVRWRPVAGCQLKLDDGGWAPATAARVLP